jgi:hypothetical protein
MGKVPELPARRACFNLALSGAGRMILAIAEGSVEKILASAIRKLDCANNPQAVIKALRLGLIH